LTPVPAVVVACPASVPDGNVASAAVPDATRAHAPVTRRHPSTVVVTAGTVRDAAMTVPELDTLTAPRPRNTRADTTTRPDADHVTANVPVPVNVHTCAYSRKLALLVIGP
jgi:hypothetical protein